MMATMVTAKIGQGQIAGVNMWDAAIRVQCARITTRGQVEPSRCVSRGKHAAKNKNEKWSEQQYHGGRSSLEEETDVKTGSDQRLLLIDTMID